MAFSDRGLTMISARGSEKDLRSSYCERFARELEPGSLPARLRRQVVDALSGEGPQEEDLAGWARSLVHEAS